MGRLVGSESLQNEAQALTDYNNNYSSLSTVSVLYEAVTSKSANVVGSDPVKSFECLRVSVW